MVSLNHRVFVILILTIITSNIDFIESLFFFHFLSIYTILYNCIVLRCSFSVFLKTNLLSSVSDLGTSYLFNIAPVNQIRIFSFSFKKKMIGVTIRPS